jgi:prepilin-type N-terminal cleavage/methylation domain-containing protein
MGQHEIRHRKDDSGYTLVELLTAMGLASVLLVAIAVVFTATTKGVRTIDTQVSTTADGRIAMEAMTRSMRVAAIPGAGGQTSAILSATSNSVSFFALLNRTGSPAATTPNPTLVAYTWDGTCLNESQTPQRTAADGSVLWDQNTSTKCLARTTKLPVFTYYTSGLATATTLVPPSAGLTLANRKLVMSIQVDLSIIDPKNPTVKAILLTDRVTLTNVSITT